MGNFMHTWRQRRLIAAMSLGLFCVLVQLAAAAEYTYGPVKIYFPKGSAEITTPALASIKKLSLDLQGKDIRALRIDGFSDNVQVFTKSPFADNKSLTLARAESVSQALQAASGLDAQLFTVSGQESSGEVAANGTEEGRALNRRVEIRAVIDGQPPPSPTSPPPMASALPPTQAAGDRITLNLRKVDIAEVFEMLSKQQRTNIVLEKDVEGLVNVNLYEVTLEEAIQTIASAAGYESKEIGLGYLIGPKAAPGSGEELPVGTEIRTYAIQYAKPDRVETILAKHLSKNGKATALTDRSMMVVEDTPLILDKIEGLLKEVDREPIQILIEAKILEITLGETESFGLNWWKIFTSTDRLLNVGATGSGRVGVRGLSSSDTGFIFSLVNDNVNIALDALNAKGRVKTLSTPKILTLENKESSVIIGDRKGYQVTTTISQVTTTSVEFLESGVILKVTPSIDSQNRILLQIHPEVSSGSVTGGIPSQTTTEVNTSLLADNGQTIFIGGLLKKKSDSSKQGVPVLEDLPVLGRVFSTTKDIQENTETIVLITPYIVAKNSEALMSNEIIKAEGIETAIQQDQADKVPAQ